MEHAQLIRRAPTGFESGILNPVEGAKPPIGGRPRSTPAATPTPRPTPAWGWSVGAPRLETRPLNAAAGGGADAQVALQKGVLVQRVHDHLFVLAYEPHLSGLG
jgi:hypothetical protein